MKNSQKVWVRGSDNYPTDVIDILEKLGAKNTYNYNGAHTHLIYFINNQGTIISAGDNTLFGNVIMEEYKEIKIKEEDSTDYKLKPYDKVLVRDRETDNWICNIFSHYTKSEEFPYRCFTFSYRYCIPYNRTTKKLIGTSNDYD